MLEWSPDSQTASRLVRVAKRYISPKIAHLTSLSPLHPNASCRAEKKGVNGRMAMAPRMFHVIPLVLFQLAIKCTLPLQYAGCPRIEKTSPPPLFPPSSFTYPETKSLPSLSVLREIERGKTKLLMLEFSDFQFCGKRLGIEPKTSFNPLYVVTEYHRTPHINF